MDILFFVFAGATGVAAALASIAIWAPRPTRVRVLAVTITALFIPIVYMQLIEMLSKPKPMSFEWYQRDAEKAVLLGISLDEGESIYLWLRLAGSVEPRYYVIPWNLKLAERLEDAVDDAVRQDSTIVLRTRFTGEASRNGAISTSRSSRRHCRRRKGPRCHRASSIPAREVSDPRAVTRPPELCAG